MAELLVVGSINMDLVQRVTELPRPGETVKASATATFSGGKGANQAVSAALSGAKVTLVGAVGSDVFADELVDALKQKGVLTDRIRRTEGSSGLAVIAVSSSGENHIVLAEGANGTVAPADVDLILQEATRFRWVLMQNEIPWETTVCAARALSTRHVKVMLNPAPARKLSREEIQLADLLVVNETEAELTAGRSADTATKAEAAAEALLALGAGAVVVTLGPAGSVYADRTGKRLRVPAFPTEAVDTTGAGDTFIGALAASLSEGDEVETALRFATAAAALSVSRPGAQASMPTRVETLARLNQAEHGIK